MTQIQDNKLMDAFDPARQDLEGEVEAGAVPELVRDDDAEFLDAGSTSIELDSFAVRVQATHPEGRGRVKLEIEACAAGLAFGDRRACVAGTRGGVAFHACDAVTVLGPPCGRGHEVALLLPLAVCLRRRRRP